ncbi:MAG: hypothetical protein ACRELE_06380, partial [Gemmatimonadales bacterium]
LVLIGGQQQLRRMVNACLRVGCESVTCAVREDLAAQAERVLVGLNVAVVPVRTATSLHTLEIGLRSVPVGDVLCTLIDTVMPGTDWDAAHRAAVSALRSADAVVAVTPFVDDESPLWAAVAPDGTVMGFGRRIEPAVVTGGVYWFGPRARTAAAVAVESGVMRLRGFLARLVETRHRVCAVQVRQIVDVDTSADLDAALALVDKEET